MAASHDDHGPPAADRAAANYRDGLAALERGELPRAIELLTRTASQGGVSGTLARYYLGEARRRAGLAAARAGRFEEAAAHLTETQRLMPGWLPLADYLARALGRLGQFERAADLLDASVAKAPREAPGDSVIRLALLQWRSGRIT